MCVLLQVAGVRVMFGVKIFLYFWDSGGEGVFAGINRKNIFLGRAQIFPRQGIIFLSAGGVNADLLVSIKFTKLQTEGE